MLKLIKVLSIYVLYAIVLGEFIVRFFSLTSDVPNRFIDKNHIQKYYPNQKGTWKGGDHKWQTNALGWPGPLPVKFDNLITILGDSFIENFMNPNECRQAYLLKKKIPQNNFLETGRSGVSLIEAMEISKQLDTLKPNYQLIYLSDTDFKESISDIARKKDITQIDLKTGKLLYGEIKAPFLKKILYNWKFLYYLFQRFPLNLKVNSTEKNHNNGFDNFTDHQIYYEKLLDHIIGNYIIENKILVFRPESSPELVSVSKEKGFKSIFLRNNSGRWSFVNDSHWTCFGHKKAAEQVAKYVSAMQ